MVIDQPTVLIILYCTVSVQQTNLLPEMTQFSPKGYITLYWATAMLKSQWLCNHLAIYKYRL